jgi:hypothetical protein
MAGHCLCGGKAGLSRRRSRVRAPSREAAGGYSINPAVFKALRGLAYDDDDGLLPSHATCALLGGASPICFQVASEFRTRCCGPERVTSKPPPFWRR